MRCLHDVIVVTGDLSAQTIFPKPSVPFPSGRIGGSKGPLPKGKGIDVLRRQFIKLLHIILLQKFLTQRRKDAKVF
jgi:hypothetical protein